MPLGFRIFAFCFFLVNLHNSLSEVGPSHYFGNKVGQNSSSSEQVQIGDDDKNSGNKTSWWNKILSHGKSIASGGFLSNADRDMKGSKHQPNYDSYSKSPSSTTGHKQRPSTSAVPRSPTITETSRIVNNNAIQITSYDYNWSSDGDGVDDDLNNNNNINNNNNHNNNQNHNQQQQHTSDLKHGWGWSTHSVAVHQNQPLYTLLGGLSFASFLGTALLLLSRRNRTTLRTATPTRTSLGEYLFNGNLLRKQDFFEVEKEKEKFVKVPPIVHWISKILSPWWYIKEEEEEEEEEIVPKPKKKEAETKLLYRIKTIDVNT